MNSKWSYIACGFAVGGALLFAMSGDFWLMILEVFFTWLNWTWAEAKRNEEIQYERQSGSSSKTEE